MLFKSNRLSALVASLLMVIASSQSLNAGLSYETKYRLAKLPLLMVTLGGYFIGSNISNPVTRIEAFLACAGLTALAGWYSAPLLGRIASTHLPMASHEYQELARKAQSALGVPPIPVKVDNDATALAACDAANMYINENRLYGDSYGVKRCTVFHEIMHKKNGDAQSAEALCGLSLFSAALVDGICTVCDKCIENNKLKIGMQYSLAFLCTGALYKFISKQSFLQERRADLQGLHATQCHVCVTEDAQQEGHTQDGYLSREEKEAIALDLKKEGKVCDYHGARLD